MNTKRTGLLCLTTATLLGASPNATAQLPPDFPPLTVYSNGTVAPGVFIGTLGGKGAATNIYQVILDNAGTPIYWNKTNLLSDSVMPNGFISISDRDLNGVVLKDESFDIMDWFSFGGDYNVDGHDFKLLCNGHALMMGMELRPIDMSQVVPGGRPDAEVEGAVLQELDANKQVIFQWRALDHIHVTNSLNLLNLKIIDFDHINSFTLDPLDNNYLVSMRGLCQLIKISRTTGEIIWRLGGKNSDFTFVGEHAENTPYYFIGQHSVHRLINGNLLFFDNGQGAGTLGRRSYSRIVEYFLDETNMTATLVWDYRHTPDIVSPSGGSVKRFKNGNTQIGWYSATRNGVGPFLTEVSPAKSVVFEMSCPGFKGQCEVTKQVWNSSELIRSTNYQNVVSGQTYASPLAGVAVTVNSLTGPTENELVVSRHLEAVRFPQFAGKAPQVLVERVTLYGSNLATLNFSLGLNLPDNSFCFDTPVYKEPAQLTVYHRPIIGSGQFTALATTYDSGGQKLNVTTTQLGEFIFTYPDLPEIPLAPALNKPANGGSVNQEQPVRLDWSPRGFARAYHLQVATDAGFSNLVLDEPGLTEIGYTLPAVSPNTDYFWRVNATNTGGTSSWASASFAAVPPMIQVTAPKGGEAWRRGLTYFVQWSNNLAEPVSIELYKAGALVTKLSTNAPNLGAYQWAINFTNVPGSDYTIKISSATNAALFATSAMPFSIVDAPAINAGSISRLPNGWAQFDLTAPGAATATVLGSTNLSTWQQLGTVPVTGGSATFTDESASNEWLRFYQVRVP